MNGGWRWSCTLRPNGRNGRGVQQLTNPRVFTVPHSVWCVAHHQGAIVDDKMRDWPWHKKSFGDHVQLPYERAGTLIVFKVYDRISYGLVIGARSPMQVADRVYNP